jgi:hypothetical protein
MVGVIDGVYVGGSGVMVGVAVGVAVVAAYAVHVTARSAAAVNNHRSQVSHKLF